MSREKIARCSSSAAAWKVIKSHSPRTIESLGTEFSAVVSTIRRQLSGMLKVSYYFAVTNNQIRAASESGFIIMFCQGSNKPHSVPAGPTRSSLENFSLHSSLISTYFIAKKLSSAPFRLLILLSSLCLPFFLQLIRNCSSKQ